MSKLEESAFGLSEEELEQIRYLELLKRRRSSTAKPRFSDHLSVEAQIAMQMTMDEMKLERTHTSMARSEDVKDSVNGVCDSEKGIRVNKKERRKSRLSEHLKSGIQNSVSSSGSVESDDYKTKRLSDTYEKRNSARMRGDITDKDYDPTYDRRRGLGGVKVESAMEITEIVYHDELGDPLEDDVVIEQIALQNAVEKVSVWMETSPEPGMLKLDGSDIEWMENVPICALKGKYDYFDEMVVLAAPEVAIYLNQNAISVSVHACVYDEAEYDPFILWITFRKHTNVCIS